MKCIGAGREPALALLTAVLVCTAAVSQAATINVTANASDVLNGADAQCSLREAIQNINDGASTYADCVPAGAYGSGDTINIPAGTYTTAIAGAGENLNASGDYDINRSMALVGAGAPTTIIDGGGLDRVFHITGAYTVSITGVTITGGRAAGSNYHGGGVMVGGGTLTLNNSIVTGNAAPVFNYGGGIHVDSNGTLLANNSTISGNSAYGGGGVTSWGLVTLTNSTVGGNTSVDDGGGFYNAATASLINSTISGNRTPHFGGGIFNQTGGHLTVTDSSVIGNIATGSTYNYGGGIYNNDAATTDITRSTIGGNSATNASSNGRGGGLFNNTGTATMTVTNSTISGNTANNGGGILNVGLLTVTGSTIVRNVAPPGQGAGHGRYSVGLNGTNVYINSIVADNGAGLDCTAALTNNGGNIDSDSSCGTFTHSAAMIQGTGFGPLASNGGPTQTHALLAGSAALDAAPTCAGLTTDQRGTARPQGSACDVGAYELAVAVVAATPIPTGNVWAMIGFMLLAGLGAVHARSRASAAR